MSQKARPIILSIDGSENAEKAFEFLAKNCIHEDGTDNIILLHIIEPLALPSLALSGPAAVTGQNLGEWQRILEHQLQVAQQLKDKYEARLPQLKSAGCEVHVESAESASIGHTIVQYAWRQNAQWIVIGCRGMGLLRRTVLGSVSDYVMTHAGLPVTIVKT